MSNPTMIFTDVDYEAQGKQVDWLNLPHSVTRSAYGAISIPITVIRNGAGPAVFLMAGNHGDEYEGQIVLAKLIRELEPEHVRGRLIILPASNLPAAMAGTATSGAPAWWSPSDSSGASSAGAAWHIWPRIVEAAPQSVQGMRRLPHRSREKSRSAAHVRRSLFSEGLSRALRRR